MTDTPAPSSSATRLLRAVEDSVAYLALALLALIPFVNAVLRTFTRLSIFAAGDYVLNLVLIVAFIAAGITARDNQHLGISILRARLPGIVQALVAMLTAMITTAFAWSALSFCIIGFQPGQTVGFVPIQLFAAAMPVALSIMAVRSVVTVRSGRVAALVAASGMLLGSALAIPSILKIGFAVFPNLPGTLYGLLGPYTQVAGAIAIPLALILIAAAAVGAPIYAVLGGIAYLLFVRSGGALEVIPNEGYTMLTGSSIAAIPLFTVAGFILSESRAGERLIRLFRALVGWMPGGIVIAAVLVSTFFTTFTGASGVTILALGGLLYFILVESGHYTPRMSTGMLTAFGSIGLLFAPSLAIIIYGSVAQINIFSLFVGGFLPGILMVAAMAVIGVVVSIRRKIRPVPFDGKELLAALRGSVWEVLLPVVVVLAYFTGFTTLVETAALALVYVFVLEVIVRREIRFRALGRVVGKSLPIIGGVLIILAAARGLSYYFIDAEVPQRLSQFVAATVSSRFVFLLVLNLALLVTGAFMDIFSAITVVAPLIIPLGAAFGVDPIHLGIIFIANMELGFITPPVGLNLFLASYRFELPLMRVYRNVFPYFLVQLGMVLIITYVPDITLWLTRIIHFRA